MFGILSKFTEYIICYFYGTQTEQPRQATYPIYSINMNDKNLFEKLCPDDIYQDVEEQKDKVQVELQVELQVEQKETPKIKLRFNNNNNNRNMLLKHRCNSCDKIIDLSSSTLFCVNDKIYCSNYNTCILKYNNQINQIFK